MNVFTHASAIAYARGAAAALYRNPATRRLGCALLVTWLEAELFERGQDPDVTRTFGRAFELAWRELSVPVGS